MVVRPKRSLLTVAHAEGDRNRTAVIREMKDLFSGGLRGLISTVCDWLVVRTRGRIKGVSQLAFRYE